MSRPPADPMAAFRAAADLDAQGRREAAADAWADLTRWFPNVAEAWNNLGRTLTSLGRYAEAERALARAVALKPGASWAHHSLGVLYKSQRRWPDAEAALARAVQANPSDPTAKLELAHVYLAMGDYARGWPLYEHRKDVPGQFATRLDLPEWQGEPLAGKRLLVWLEQGFGDTLQFARFVPELKALGAEVVWVCQPELAPLFEGLGARIVPYGPELTLEAPDYWTLLLSIPHRLGTTLETLPQPPYLRAPQDRRERWAGHVEAGSVGFVWRGNPNNVIDHHRSLSSADALAGLARHAPLVDLQAPLGDFADLAAVLEQLDLLVSVDTAPAHLAGALGKDCWVLLSRDGTDWRWMSDRADSPWYPSVRLFRQQTAGDWAPVIAEVEQALAERRRGQALSGSSRS
jgi:hypothetical protein